MNRDRGRIKWSSLMLPEHVTMLRRWAEEDTYEEAKLLDEQKLEALDDVASMAMEFGNKVVVTHFVDHHREEIIGKIHYFDAIKKEFRIVDETDGVIRISIGQIDQITILE